MSISENDGDNVFTRHFQQSKRHLKPPKSYTNATDDTDEFSPAVSWPILLAVVPTLGAFVVGSAEIWSDFLMLILILFYVYKWMTGT